MVFLLLANGVSSNSKTVTTDEYFQNFCREILDRHYFIRSASIADHLGHLLATACRQGLGPLLTSEESARAAAQAAIRAATRNKLLNRFYESFVFLNIFFKIQKVAIVTGMIDLLYFGRQ